MEWLVDDFLVDPTSPFLNKSTKNEKPSSPSPINVSNHCIDGKDEEELLDSKLPLIPLSAQKQDAPARPRAIRSAPGSLKRNILPVEAIDNRIETTTTTRATPGRIRRRTASDNGIHESLGSSEAHHPGPASDEPKLPQQSTITISNAESNIHTAESQLANLASVAPRYEPSSAPLSKPPMDPVAKSELLTIRHSAPASPLESNNRDGHDGNTKSSVVAVDGNVDNTAADTAMLRQALTNDTGSGEDHDDASSSEPSTFLSTSAIPRQVEMLSEFEARDVVSVWESDGQSYERHMNRIGVFHVRVLRAQRLPCPVGSKVQAIVSLKPWKGRVRSNKTTAYSNSSTRFGVCATWDEVGPPISVTHAYTSEESPVPMLQVDIVFNPLGVFDVALCSISADCHGLLCVPMVPRQQWFAADGFDDRLAPMVEVEAVFQPTDRSGDGDIPGADDSPVPVRDGSHCSSQMDELSQSDVSMSLQTVSRHDRRNASAPHLLRSASHWKPAICCVCKRSITSVLRKRNAYRCEACGVDCCVDCQLQVDFKLPCRSEKAETARKNAVQNRLTVDNILNTVAPVDDSHSSLRTDSIHSRNMRLNGGAGRDMAVESDAEGVPGVGTLKLLVLRACVLDQSLAPDAEYCDLLEVNNTQTRKGDYYVSVSSRETAQTKRTRTVQSSDRPRFDANEIRFAVPHYGTEFLVELIDATTDESIGMALLTTQCLLQLQRDSLAEQPLASFVSRIRGLRHQHSLRLSLALRTGVKKGYGYDFFVDAKADPADHRAKGTIVGVVEVRAVLEEDTSSLFGMSPYECPARPPDKLDMALFQRHIARIASLVTDIMGAVERYKYVVSWKEPWLTAVSMVCSLYFSCRFDPAYVACVPCAFIIALMIYSAVARKRGQLKEAVLAREIEVYAKVSSVKVDSSLFRPSGHLLVNVTEGRNLRSDLGLPGKVGCRVYWDSGRFAKDRATKKSGLVEGKLDTHDIGATNFQLSMRPKWDRLTESVLTKRLKLLLPTATSDNFFEYNTSEERIGFPVLQPVKRLDDGLHVLMPWHQSVSAVVVEVTFMDALSFLPGSTSLLGEVVIPFTLIAKRKEISGWFDIIDERARGCPDPCQFQVENDSKSDTPQLYLNLAWKGPEKEPANATELEREASLVIQEEFERSSILASQSKSSLVGHSIGAFNRVVGISEQLQLVQNTLGTILDTLGALRNAFNFADPYKSMVIFCVVCVAWLFFALVPTRVLLVVGIVVQHAITFRSRFSHHFTPDPDGSKPVHDFTVKADEKGLKQHTSPYATWLMNAFLAIPTDEDIRKTYHWECVQKRSQVLAANAAERRTVRLKRLWRAQWYSQVLLLETSDDGTVIKLKVFALVQGNRFLWWHSVDEFDRGDAWSGRLFLDGHAGLTTPSPIEMRALHQDEFGRFVGIFGRGIDGQEKVTLVAPSEEIKASLELAVQFATTSKKD